MEPGTNRRKGGLTLPPAEIGRPILDPAVLTCPDLILPVLPSGTSTNTDIRRGPRTECHAIFSDQNGARPLGAAGCRGSHWSAAAVCWNPPL